jgi:hypothetical protein
VPGEGPGGVQGAHLVGLIECPEVAPQLTLPGGSDDGLLLIGGQLCCQGVEAVYCTVSALEGS